MHPSPHTCLCVFYRSIRTGNLRNLLEKHMQRYVTGEGLHSLTCASPPLIMSCFAWAGMAAPPIRSQAGKLVPPLGERSAMHAGRFEGNTQPWNGGFQVVEQTNRIFLHASSTTACCPNSQARPMRVARLKTQALTLPGPACPPDLGRLTTEGRSLPTLSECLFPYVPFSPGPSLTPGPSCGARSGAGSMFCSPS